MIEIIERSDDLEIWRVDLKLLIDPKQEDSPDLWDWPTLLDLPNNNYVTIIGCNMVGIKSNPETN
jgi:hypothetical protein